MQPTVPATAHNPNDHTDTDIIDAVNGRSGVRRWSFRYDLLDSTNQFIQPLDNVIAGSVSQNWLADIKRTANFTVEEVAYIDYLSDRIQPWVRLHLPPYGPDDWCEWPQGVFVLSTPTRRIDAQGRVTREVEGYDLLQVLADDRVSDRYTIAAGTAYTSAVISLLPAGAINVQASAKTVPVDLEWDPGTSKLEIVNELLGALNYHSLAVDEWGTYVAAAYQPPSERPDEWTYADDTAGLIIPGPDQTLDLFSVANHWVRVISEPDRDELVSSYTNNDPASLTSTVRRGRTITDFAAVLDAADQTTLDNIVARVAFEASQVFEVLDFETGLNPLHSGNDVYRLRYTPLAVDATYSEHRWDMTLRAGAPMAHRARRVVAVSP